MLGFIAAVHIIIALILIVLVLLQDSKGGAMGMLGGGGGNSVLGTSAGNFLTTATKWVATIFATTCIVLAYLTTHQSESVLDNYVPPAQDQQNAITPQKTDPAATDKSTLPEENKK